MNEILEQVIDHVTPRYQSSDLGYHNYDHVSYVAQKAEWLALNHGWEKDSEEFENLMIACWFHDLCYDQGGLNHEVNSAREARSYLLSKGLGEERIAEIERLIIATTYSRIPNGKAEKIIKDADTAHLGNEDFWKFLPGVRSEMEATKDKPYSDLEWLENNIAFLENHEYYTSPAKKVLEPIKQINIKSIKSQRKEIKASGQSAGRPDRGIETMFRVALRNHNQLSKIADNKANMMLSIVTIMLSLILSTLVPKIDSNQELLIPTTILLIVSLLTIYFAIKAAMPSISSAPYSREKLENNKVNLLFFGNFYKLPLDEFEWGIDKLMEDRDLLYGSLSKDLYFLGKVLAKKYKAIRTAFLIFLYGLILATVSFIYAVL